MPFYLSDRDISSEVADARSVLVVPCRFCPAASLSGKEKKPYIELFRRFLRTESFESYVRELRARLERMGIRVTVFDSRWPHQFVVCMWTAGRRRQLSRLSAGQDAVIVLGCDAALETVRGCTSSTDCRVVPGMAVEGILNVVPSLRFPFDIALEVTGVTRVLAAHDPSGAGKTTD